MPEQEKIILGIDPGIADTGYGVVAKSRSRVKYIVAGSIQTPKEKDLISRLDTIYLKVKELIEKYQPELVAVEKLYFAKNVKTALDVGQARGVVLLAISQANCEFLEFTPLQVKQAIAASGQANKRQVGLMVKTILGLDRVPQPDDAADALAIAIVAASYNKKLA